MDEVSDIGDAFICCGVDERFTLRDALIDWLILRNMCKPITALIEANKLLDQIERREKIEPWHG